MLDRYRCTPLNVSNGCNCWLNYLASEKSLKDWRNALSLDEGSVVVEDDPVIADQAGSLLLLQY